MKYLITAATVFLTICSITTAYADTVIIKEQATPEKNISSETVIITDTDTKLEIQEATPEKTVIIAKDAVPTANSNPNGVNVIKETVIVKKQITPKPGMQSPIKASDYNILKGENGTILLFVRSVDWCPYCQQQLINWNSQAERFEALGYKIHAVSYDPIATQDKFRETHNITIDIISDPQSNMIKSFNILNTDMKQETKYYGIPYPYIFVINENNTVTHVFAEKDYKIRPNIEMVYEALK